MLLPISVVCAQGEAFEDLNLDQLMSLDVQNTSVMKRATSLDKTPASIYVLSANKIKHSGAQNISEVIDLIPGVFMRYANHNQPIVAVRRIPSMGVNSMLVMIDGRPIYNPLFPDIPWNNISLSVNSIERVELIRGSGGSIWSSQAANSVINIITKHSFENQKNIISVAAGTKVQGLAQLQLAGFILDSGSYNVNFNGYKTKQSTFEEGHAFDAYLLNSVDFRIDYNQDNDLTYLISGSYLTSDIQQTYGAVSQPLYRMVEVQTDDKNSNADIMLRIDHQRSPYSSEQLQFSYSDTYMKNDLFGGGMKLSNIIYSINYQLGRHKWGWGLDYQYNTISVDDSDYLTLLESAPTSNQRFGGYLQHEYLLDNDKTRLFSTLRLDKVAGNFEYQPSLKITHSLAENTSVWSSLSRAVMTPTEFEKYVVLSRESGVENPLLSGAYIPSYFVGNPDLAAEVQNTFEMGYRTAINNAQIDFSVFHGKSSNARAARVDTLATPQFNVVGVNSANSQLTGAELVIKQKVSPKWQVEFSASYLDQNVESYGENVYRGTASSVMQEYSIRSDYQLNKALSSYLKVDYASGYLDAANLYSPSYTTFDAGIIWQANKHLNVALYGQNLFDSEHREVTSGNADIFRSTAIERSFLLKAQVSF